MPCHRNHDHGPFANYCCPRNNGGGGASGASGATGGTGATGATGDTGPAGPLDLFPFAANGPLIMPQQALNTLRDSPSDFILTPGIPQALAFQNITSSSPNWNYDAMTGVLTALKAGRYQFAYNAEFTGATGIIDVTTYIAGPTIVDQLPLNGSLERHYDTVDVATVTVPGVGTLPIVGQGLRIFGMGNVFQADVAEGDLFQLQVFVADGPNVATVSASDTDSVTTPPLPPLQAPTGGAWSLSVIDVQQPNAPTLAIKGVKNLPVVKSVRKAKTAPSQIVEGPQQTVRVVKSTVPQK